jgi:hypothetical protein
LDYINKLNKDLVDASERLKGYERKNKELSKKHENANALVTGLSSSKIRWEQNVLEYNKDYELLDGNVLLSAVYFSYMGAFPSEYRE